MMKSFCSVVFCSLVFSAATNAAPPLDLSTSALGDETAYETLGREFDSAGPLKITDIPLYSSAEAKRWHCASTSESTPSDLTPMDAPVRFENLVTTPAKAGLGPLFPGTPEKMETVYAILFGAEMSATEAADYYQMFVKYEYRLQLTPTLEIDWILNQDNPSIGRGILTFRSKNGMWFLRQRDTNPDGKHAFYENSYCWQD